MPFEWDAKKNRHNLRKHGFSFEDAEIVFSSPMFTIEDSRSAYGEARLISLGSLLGRVVVVVHTRRGDSTRIISMRKANARETKVYKEQFGKS